MGVYYRADLIRIRTAGEDKSQIIGHQPPGARGHVATTGKNHIAQEGYSLRYTTKKKRKTLF